jgi:hypothetical protein
MEEDQIRIKVIREAVDELWGKMVDMQRGDRPLSETEWRQALRRLEGQVKQLAGLGEGV